MVESQGSDNKLASSPILHDIIKAYLTYDFRAIFSFCATLPQVRRSRIFLPTTPHRLMESRQEWFLDGIRYPADAVWIFKNDWEIGSYYIVHEIKTGKYDIKEEIRKHYIHHNHVSFWIWAYPQFHTKNEVPAKHFIKKLPLHLLLPYIYANLGVLIGGNTHVIT